VATSHDGIVTSAILVRDAFGGLIITDNTTRITITHIPDTTRRLLQQTAPQTVVVVNGIALLPTVIECAAVQLTSVPPLNVTCISLAAKLVVTGVPAQFVNGLPLQINPVVILVDAQNQRSMLDTRVVAATLVFANGAGVPEGGPWFATAVAGAAAFTDITPPASLNVAVVFVFTAAEVSPAASRLIPFTVPNIPGLAQAAISRTGATALALGSAVGLCAVIWRKLKGGTGRMATILTRAGASRATQLDMRGFLALRV
jgi:hypothetical protein